MEYTTNIRILISIIKNKKSREIFCKTYISENPMLSEHIIDFWQLQRINKKYITKERLYDENSYSKRKIREEEVIFIRKQSIFQPLRYYFEEQRLICDKMFADLFRLENKAIDYEFYRRTILDSSARIKYPQIPIVFKKNNRVRIDLNNELLEIPELRETVTKEYITKYPELSNLVIEKYKLNFIKYKYFDCIITKFESSYTRSKIKREEIFMISKVFQYSVWLRRLKIFDDIGKTIFDEFLIEQENRSLQDNKLFLELITENIISEYSSESFDIDDDINID